jgi:hypothetical protein
MVACDKDKEKENVPIKISMPTKRKPKAKSSWVWSYFKPSANGEKTKYFCMPCSQDVHYGWSCSTGMLEHHLRSKHLKLYSDRCAECALEKIDRESKEKTSFQTSFSSFVTAFPNF